MNSIFYNDSYKTLTYYSFQEVFELLEIYIDPELTSTLQNLADKMYNTYNISNTYYTIDTYSESVFKMIAYKFYDYSILKIEDGEETLTASLLTDITSVYAKALVKWYSRFMIIMKSTYDKYKTLLAAYAAQTDFLKKVESTAKTKFNDTPQNSGTYEDEYHNSNVTIYSSGSDAGTVAERLKEIDEKYQSVLYDWSAEFDKIFFEEEV